MMNLGCTLAAIGAQALATNGQDAVERLGLIATPGEESSSKPALIRIDDRAGVRVEVLLRDTAPLPGAGVREPEPFLHFYDDQGALTLGHCFATGFRGNAFGGGTYRWSLGAGYAVEGADFRNTDSELVHRLRSSMTGLHLWAAWGNTSLTVRKDEKGRPEEVVVSKRLPDAVTFELDDIVASLHLSAGTKGVDFTSDWTTLETSTETAEEWWRHLRIHGDLRTLVALCLWSPVDFVSHEVQQSVASRILSDGTEIGRPWRRLYLLHRSRRARGKLLSTPELKHEHFMFPDVANAGVTNWLRTSERYGRALRPLMYYLYLDDLPIESSMIHVGVCVEALRYADRIAAGDDPSVAAQETFQARAYALAEQANTPFADLGIDTQRWSRAFATAYNSVKHANRDAPDPGDMFWLTRTGAVLARTRLLQIAGIPDEGFRRMETSSWWHPMMEGIGEVLARE